MKIYPEKLAAELKKGLARVYLISGDEPLLRQQLCDQIRAAARSVGFVERDLFHVETNFDWQALHYSANSLSLFADKKLIEVRLSAAKQPEKAAKALLELASVGEDLVVLLSLPKADASVQKTKWFKALETVGVLVQVWPIESKDLPRWIENRFKDKGFRITRDAVLALSARVEGNLLRPCRKLIDWFCQPQQLRLALRWCKQPLVIMHAMTSTNGPMLRVQVRRVAVCEFSMV